MGGPTNRRLLHLTSGSVNPRNEPLGSLIVDPLDYLLGFRPELTAVAAWIGVHLGRGLRAAALLCPSRSSSCMPG